ncbi:kinesin-related [Holotrichia oblita]|uniref:Kinesin-related n=1 Tax=Holotrichia oblita TaxID=644536 RepID=A0ACB9TBX2_HOLOL|nr:kinesin-related [Holotrichia oblita]
MALSAPSTPKDNLKTPRKIAKPVATTSQTPKFYKCVTPKHNNVTKRNREIKTEEGTPRHPRLDNNQENIPPQTPTCYNNVTIETPVATKIRISKDKCDELTNLTVAVRVRPMNSRELAYIGATNIVKTNQNELIIHSNSNLSMSTDHIFQYDHVFWSCDESDKNYASQECVFSTIAEPLLANAFRGYNACLFAYGQTGSGKSFSMMGDMCSNMDCDKTAGITPRFCKRLFEKLKEIQDTITASIELSYFEIYNEKIHDLLACNVGSNKTALKVREHPVWGPYVVDLSVHVVNSYEEMKERLLIGNKNRVTAATLMNEKSSRSHSIFSIELNLSERLDESSSSRRSKVSLVDLAGSERLGNLYNNEEKIREGVSINKSLLTLGKVISALSEYKKGNIFVPYRDSVLTWLLRESLGGNSLTSMLATITPANTHIDETLATLRYACQARSIVNRARINENPHDRLIRELRAEVERLRALRQDYEKHSNNSSIMCTSDSLDQSEELDSLRQKLIDTEEKLTRAEEDWKYRLKEAKLRQQAELSEAEKRRDELESHIRVMNQANTDISLSPYKSNFLQELEGMLHDNLDEHVGKKMTKTDVTASMNQIYEIMSNLRPSVDDVDENVKLLFARVNKLLQAFETALINSLNKTGVQKTVTFKL